MKLGLIFVSGLALATAGVSCAAKDPNCPAPFVIVAGDGGETDSGYDEPFDTPAGYSQPMCAAACANLRLRGCPEGTTRPGEDSCYVVCMRAEETRVIDFKTSCVAKAKTKIEIKRCGTYRCM